MKQDHDFWTEERVTRAAHRWNDGATLSDIAESLGCTRSSVSGMISRNRGMFERRQASPSPKVIIANATKAKRRPLSADIPKVKRTVTLTGAQVTMRHVSFIDGPIQWNGESTSFGPAFNKAPARELF